MNSKVNIWTTTIFPPPPYGINGLLNPRFIWIPLQTSYQMYGFVVPSMRQHFHSWVNSYNGTHLSLLLDQAITHEGSWLWSGGVTRSSTCHTNSGCQSNQSSSQRHGNSEEWSDNLDSCKLGLFHSMDLPKSTKNLAPLSIEWYWPLDQSGGVTCLHCLNPQGNTDQILVIFRTIPTLVGWGGDMGNETRTCEEREPTQVRSKNSHMRGVGGDQCQSLVNQVRGWIANQPRNP